MKWNHIMDKQPEHGEKIVQCDPPYEGRYLLGINVYYAVNNWEEHLAYLKKSCWGLPDFWWISAKDFPWPDRNESPPGE